MTVEQIFNEACALLHAGNPIEPILNLYPWLCIIRLNGRTLADVAHNKGRFFAKAYILDMLEKKHYRFARITEF